MLLSTLLSTTLRCTLRCKLLSTLLRSTFLHTSERERNVLFNDALNTFYLRLYGVRHMVKDHSDS